MDNVLVRSCQYCERARAQLEAFNDERRNKPDLWVDTGDGGHISLECRKCKGNGGTLTEEGLKTRTILLMGTTERIDAIEVLLRGVIDQPCIEKRLESLENAVHGMNGSIARMSGVHQEPPM